VEKELGESPRAGKDGRVTEEKKNVYAATMSGILCQNTGLLRLNEYAAADVGQSIISIRDKKYLGQEVIPVLERTK
jgi:hypothetical protein